MATKQMKPAKKQTASPKPLPFEPQNDESKKGLKSIKPPQINKEIRQEIRRSVEIAAKLCGDYMNIRLGDLSESFHIGEMFDIPDTAPPAIISIMSQLATEYAYWAYVRMKVDEHLADIQRDYDAKYNEWYLAEVVPGEKSTETMRDANAKSKHKVEYESFQKRIADATSASKSAKTILEALSIKKEMVQSIGAMLRAEMDNAVKAR